MFYLRDTIRKRGKTKGKKISSLFFHYPNGHNRKDWDRMKQKIQKSILFLNVCGAGVQALEVYSVAFLICQLIAGSEAEQQDVDFYSEMGCQHCMQFLNAVPQCRLQGTKILTLDNTLSYVDILDNQLTKQFEGLFYAFICNIQRKIKICNVSENPLLHKFQDVRTFYSLMHYPQLNNVLFIIYDKLQLGKGERERG